MWMYRSIIGQIDISRQFGYHLEAATWRTEKGGWRPYAEEHAVGTSGEVACCRMPNERGRFSRTNRRRLGSMDNKLCTWQTTQFLLEPRPRLHRHTRQIQTKQEYHRVFAAFFLNEGTAFNAPLQCRLSIPAQSTASSPRHRSDALCHGAWEGHRGPQLHRVFLVQLRRTRASQICNRDASSYHRILLHEQVSPEAYGRVMQSHILAVKLRSSQ